MSARPKEPLPLHEKQKKAATVHPAIKAIAGEGRHGVGSLLQTAELRCGLHVQGPQVALWRHAACNPWTPSRPDFSWTRSSNTMVGAAAVTCCKIATNRHLARAYYIILRMSFSTGPSCQAINLTLRDCCSGIVHCGKTVYTEEGLRALWKGLTPFATHLTLKYALRMGTNAAYQSALRDEVRSTASCSVSTGSGKA